MNARTQVYAREASEIDASTQRAIAARAEQEKPRRMSALEAMAMRCRVTEKELTAALTSTVFKECKSQAQFLALVVVANEYGLNPLTKEIYAFPNKGGGVVPMVSVDGWISLMNRHPDHDGIEFDYHEDDKGNLIAVESIIYHKGRSHPIKTMEFMAECKGTTGPWQKSPRRMMRHRALIQGVRIAYGFSGIYAETDQDDGILTGEYSVAGDGPLVLPGKEQFANSSDDDGAEDEHDSETGEVARDPQTGMSEVDEETARELDGQAAYGGGEVDEVDVVQEQDEVPAWQAAVDGLKQMIAAAKTRRAWQVADTEFQKIAAGLPDPVAQELDELLVAKRNEIVATTQG